MAQIWPRSLRPILVVTCVILLFGFATSADACSTIPSEPMKYMVRVLKGKEGGSLERPGPREVISVWERRTIKRWESVGDRTAASVSIVTRWWGEPIDERWQGAEYRGGHLTGAAATTTSCGTDVAYSVGTREFFAVLDGGEVVPIEDPKPTKRQLATLNEQLGRNILVHWPEFPDEHPFADEAVAEEIPQDSGSWMVWAVLGAGVILAGAIVWGQRPNDQGNTERSEDS